MFLAFPLMSQICENHWRLNELRHITAPLPIGSMYAIYGNIYHQYTPNVSIYTIHGSFGLLYIIWYYGISTASATHNVPHMAASCELRLSTPCTNFFFWVAQKSSALRKRHTWFGYRKSLSWMTLVSFAIYGLRYFYVFLRFLIPSLKCHRSARSSC